MGEVWVSGRAGRHREREFRARDGVTVPFRHWAATGQPWATVCHLHGQGEHSGAFAAMGDYLADQGLDVYAPDQRGFGRSRQPRGDVHGFGTFIGDADEMIRLARGEGAGRPVFLMGLSMGGHIATRVAARLNGKIAGLVALSPGFRLRRTPLRAILITLWYALLRPGQLLPSVIEGVATTRNRVHLARAEVDPTYVRAFTARFYVHSMLSLRQAWREARRIRVPVLMVVGDADPLVDPDAARRYFERIPAADKEFVRLPGVYHNLPAEPNMRDIAATVVAWMRRHTP